MSSVKWEDLPSANLVVEAIYQGKRARPLDLSCAPLTRLIPKVGNMGGFRVKIGVNKEPVALVLVSTGTDTDWPDQLDIFEGKYTYFGDNKHPGKALHDTPNRGNRHLARIFELAHGDPADRLKSPLILVFHSTGFEHDLVFLGLAVPGASDLGAREDLVAEWAAKGGKRFQNYRATFTILDTGEIDGSWVRDIFALRAFDIDDLRVPKVYRDWVQKRKYSPLRVDPKSLIRTIAQQLPLPGLERQLVERIIKFCKSDPWLFEAIARDIWEMSYPAKMEIELTRKWRDGGRDALGKLILGPQEDPLKIEFVLEAKCFDFKSRVTTRHMSRLVSRIKHREFGVMVTTSAVDQQAYKEIRSDNHPIIIMSGTDIAKVLIHKGINNPGRLQDWLASVNQTRIS